MTTIAVAKLLEDIERLKNKVDATIRCPECDLPINDTWTFCPCCGEYIRK